VLSRLTKEWITVTDARDRLGSRLTGDAASVPCVALTARADNLILEVEGFGPVKFPVTPAKARKLIGLGQPARFGRGEETLTDASVRDTWEIPRELVRATWDDAVLRVILGTVKQELGLPNGSSLTPELHSLLIYEPGQFFVAHQDSEKDDSMVGTLVVTLPSNYTGGELMIGHNGERKAYRGSKTALSLVAFYADCQHEVLNVKSGYRITLTYNLLLHGDTRRPEGDAGTVSELAFLLREHFASPVSSYRGGPAPDPPNRLVYLLDHEYTPRALNWSRLKGADGNRAALLRQAADAAGCEAILALADIKTTHSAFKEGGDDYYGYGGRGGWEDDDEVDDEAVDDGAEYEIHELFDTEVTLTHWTGPDGTRLEEVSLFVRDYETCASTPTGALDPYESQYEGYMGNWGNTLDRWYHRAAVVVWPREQAFANRAETSPAWALDTLAGMAEAGDAEGARAAARTMRPFWDGASRAPWPGIQGRAAGLLGKALGTARAVADPETAAMLLRPFRVESLTAGCADAFAAVVSEYGVQWTADLLGTWFGEYRHPGLYGWEHDRQEWAAGSLPGLCAGMGAASTDGAAAARRLLGLTWEWLGKDIPAILGVSSRTRRDQALDDLGKPLGALLKAAAILGADSARDEVTAFVRKQSGDSVTVLELATLRAADAPADCTPLASDCAARIRARLERPAREPGDWSIELPGDCACELCAMLKYFLAAKDRRAYEWPLAKERRRHIHTRIDDAGLPVTHVTKREGRPYKLILKKTDALFTQERDARTRDEADLAWLSSR
jgi:2-oxoglutarate-Fe(II)-dependent oxygenase superfamily protein